MELWDYLEVAGGYALMIVCILGNFAWSYVASYSQSRWQSLKRILLFWLITTLVFCFFFVRENVHEMVIGGAMFLPLKGLIVSQSILMLYLTITRTRLVANRLKVFEPQPRFTLTYENEAAFLVATQTIIGLAWIVSVV